MDSWNVSALNLLGCRWHNHLNPSIKRDAWTEEEDLQLIGAHQLHGNKWAEIAKHLPGRCPLHPSHADVITTLPTLPTLPSPDTCPLVHLWVPAGRTTPSRTTGTRA